MVAACEAYDAFSSPTSITLLSPDFVRTMFKSYTSKKSLIPATYDNALYQTFIADILAKQKRGQVPKLRDYLLYKRYIANDDGLEFKAHNFTMFKRYIHKLGQKPTLTLAANDLIKNVENHGVRRSKTHGDSDVVQAILSGQTDHQSYLSITDALNLVKDAQRNVLDFHLPSSHNSVPSDDLPKNSLVFTLTPPSIFFMENQDGNDSSLSNDTVEALQTNKTSSANKTFNKISNITDKIPSLNETVKKIHLNFTTNSTSNETLKSHLKHELTSQLKKEFTLTNNEKSKNNTQLNSLGGTSRNDSIIRDQQNISSTGLKSLNAYQNASLQTLNNSLEGPHEERLNLSKSSHKNESTNAQVESNQFVNNTKTLNDTNSTSSHKNVPNSEFSSLENKQLHKINATALNSSAAKPTSSYKVVHVSSSNEISDSVSYGKNNEDDLPDLQNVNQLETKVPKYSVRKQHGPDNKGQPVKQSKIKLFSSKGITDLDEKVFTRPPKNMNFVSPPKFSSKHINPLLHTIKNFYRQSNRPLVAHMPLKKVQAYPLRPKIPLIPKYSKNYNESTTHSFQFQKQKLSAKFYPKKILNITPAAGSKMKNRNRNLPNKFLQDSSGQSVTKPYVKSMKTGLVKHGPLLPGDIYSSSQYKKKTLSIKNLKGLGPFNNKSLKLKMLRGKLNKPIRQLHQTISRYLKLDRLSPEQALRVPYDPKD